MKLTLFHLASISALAVGFGCADREAPTPTSPLESAERSLSSRPAVVLPAGSVDGLADALEAAGDNGTVLVEAGMHTESGTVLITQRVRIVGEDGATLVVSTTPAPSYPSTMDPALHLVGADQTSIENLEILPAAEIGSTGVLIEDSRHVQVSGCEIRRHQWSIVTWGGTTRGSRTMSSSRVRRG